MKPHLIVCCTLIGLFCLLIFGLRGLDAVLVGVITFLLGVNVGKQEAQVTTFLARQLDAAKKFFDGLLK